MEFVAELWMPILVGTVVLWFLSFFAWALLPHHVGDQTQAPHEDELMRLLKEKNMPAGNYMFPYAGPKERGSKEFLDRYTEGPRGILNVYEMPNMPANMIKTILYFLVTVFTIGYITSVACPEEAPGFMKVFRIAGTIGVLTYAPSGFMNRIWFSARKWTHVLDGVVYGVVLGLVFGLLW